MRLFLVLAAAFAAALVTIAGAQPDRPVAKAAISAYAVRASDSPTPTPTPADPGSGQMSGGQMGSPSPTPNPTGQTGDGQMGNTTPTPTPSGQMGNGQMGNTSPSPSPTMQQGAGHTGTGHIERTSVPLQTMPAGTVTLTFSRHTRTVTAQLNVFGLAPGTSHRIALYRNHGGGQPAYTFPDVTVNGTGQLAQTVTSTNRAGERLPRNLFFQIDLLPTGQSQQPVAVAHRQVSEGNPNHVTLAVTSTIAQPGHATLAYDPATHQLTVSLQVSGLAPGSHHAAHIHTGSCRVQGAVLYPLPDLVANGGGSASERVTIPVQSAPPVTGWYVNVHDGTMNNILQADGQPGPLFQPLVCGNVHARQ